MGDIALQIFLSPAFPGSIARSQSDLADYSACAWTATNSVAAQAIVGLRTLSTLNSFHPFSSRDCDSMTTALSLAGGAPGLLFGFSEPRKRPKAVESMPPVLYRKYIVYTIYKLSKF